MQAGIASRSNLEETVLKDDNTATNELQVEKQLNNAQLGVKGQELQINQPMRLIESVKNLEYGNEEQEDEVSKLQEILKAMTELQQIWRWTQKLKQSLEPLELAMNTYEVGLRETLEK